MQKYNNMNVEIVETTIYTALDGKKFTDESQCRRHEDRVLAKFKYFSVFYNFDMTEGRGFQKVKHIAVVPTGFDLPEIIVEKYAIEEICHGIFAGKGAQGYGLQKYYSIKEISIDDYFENKGIDWGGMYIKSELVLISEKPIDGFPEPFNYVEKWQLEY